MHYSLFGRCCFPRSGTCNCFPRPLYQQSNNTGRCISPKENKCPNICTEKCRDDDLMIKSAAFGGFILPEGTDKRATFHVASLNLEPRGCKNFVVQLVFSCNIIASNLKMRLRFQIFKQERGQCFSTPLSAGILYFRDRVSAEANSFTLTACDCDSAGGLCCNYSACVEVEEFDSGGNITIANPVLIATIAKKD